jgi:hypothetical protein
MTRTRIAVLVALLAALAATVTGGAWASGRTASAPAGAMMATSGRAGMMGHGGSGSGMMAGAYGVPGNGRRVDTLAAARQRAQVLADRWGLRAGEVMSFANGYYAELVTADRQPATEVLVDPADGRVQVEYGPAMMWNVTYGMHPGAVTAPARLSPAEAVTAAQHWLDEQRLGLTADRAEQFPGYYTLHTLRGATIAGMMSVNAATGAVWYHTWHGQFIAMSEE